jgi:hypothetical protein
MAGNVASEVNGTTQLRPRPPMAGNSGPDWRIVHNGERYRIERRVTRPVGVATWEPWKGGVVTFRWLWAARLTMQGLIKKERAKAAEKWNAVEYAD